MQNNYALIKTRIMIFVFDQITFVIKRIIRYRISSFKVNTLRN